MKCFIHSRVGVALGKNPDKVFIPLRNSDRYVAGYEECWDCSRIGPSPNGWILSHSFWAGHTLKMHEFLKHELDLVPSDVDLLKSRGLIVEVVVNSTIEETTIEEFLA